MKIKLQEYSLISNEWIDKEIERLERIKKESDVTDYSIVGQLISLIKLKEQLIPSEKLAEHAIEYGAEVLYQTLDPNTGIAKGFKELKQKYFNSEIEIQ